MAASSSGLMLRHLVGLHGWRCWHCGEESLALDVDHVRPLWSLSEEERGEPRWWLPFNVQLLCPSCHRAKTAREARWRAMARAGAALDWGRFLAARA